MAEHLSARQRRPSMARRGKRRIAAFSKRLSFSDLDLRTNAGRFANSIKSDLEAQIGNPIPGQQAADGPAAAAQHPAPVTLHDPIYFDETPKISGDAVISIVAA